MPVMPIIEKKVMVFCVTQAHRLEQDIGRAERETERLRQESSQHKIENKKLVDDNNKLEKEIKNMVRAVQESDGSTINMDILAPTLERLLAVNMF